MTNKVFRVSGQHKGGRRLVLRTVAYSLLLTPLLALAFTTAKAQETVRVLDYNIHRDIGPNSPNSSSQAALAKVVNALDPDIWTINELGGNSSGWNASAALTSLANFVAVNITIFGANPVLGSNYFIYVGSYTDGYIGNAIVSRYPLLSTQSFSDAGGGYSSLRGMTMAVVDLPGAQDLAVFTTHLKAQGDAASAQRRQAEATADQATVSNWLSLHAGASAVVTGDFNETEDAGEGTNWGGHSIGDTLGNGTVYHPITTMKATGLADAAPASITGDRDTISSTSATKRFDYTLYTPQTLTFTDGQVFDTRQYSALQLSALNSSTGLSFSASDSATASDHLPVLTTFVVVPEPGCLVLLGGGVVWLTTRRSRATA